MFCTSASLDSSLSSHVPVGVHILRWQIAGVARPGLAAGVDVASQGLRVAECCGAVIIDWVGGEGFVHRGWDCRHCALVLEMSRF